jgi:hypothetical protein
MPLKHFASSLPKKKAAVIILLKIAALNFDLPGQHSLTPNFLLLIAINYGQW